MQFKMKCIMASAILFQLSVQAQNSVGIGTSNPNANVMLDIQAISNKHAILAETPGTGIAIQAIARGASTAVNVLKPPGSTGSGFYLDHLGDAGPGMHIKHSNPAADGPAIIGYTNSNQASSTAIYANHEGTGDAAFAARINNTGNPFAASYAETNGSGSAFFSNQIGTGRAAQIQINNAANAAIALRAFTNGTGKAGLFTITNTASNDTALMTETNGGGAALAAVQRGSFGSAGTFQITSATNSASAVKIETVGTGNAIGISSTGTATAINILKTAGSSGQGIYIDHQGDSGPVAQFRRTNATATGPAIIGYSNSNQTGSVAIYANHEGTGDAAFSARINNTGSLFAASYGETNGSGPAVFGNQIGTGRGGQFQIGNPANTQHALRSYTDGLGRAAYFTVNNASNTETALLAETNAAAGVAVGANNQSNGYAFSVIAGGTKLSTANLTSGTSITTRASAYLISGGGPYTLGFTVNDGELMYFYNLTNATVTINAIGIPPTSGKTYVVLGGILREM